MSISIGGRDDEAGIIHVDPMALVFADSLIFNALAGDDANHLHLFRHQGHERVGDAKGVAYQAPLIGSNSAMLRTG